MIYALIKIILCVTFVPSTVKKDNGEIMDASVLSQRYDVTDFSRELPMRSVRV